MDRFLERARGRHPVLIATALVMGIVWGITMIPLVLRGGILGAAMWGLLGAPIFAWVLARRV